MQDGTEFLVLSIKVIMCPNISIYLGYLFENSKLLKKQYVKLVYAVFMKQYSNNTKMILLTYIFFNSKGDFCPIKPQAVISGYI